VTPKSSIRRTVGILAKSELSAREAKAVHKVTLSSKKLITCTYLMSNHAYMNHSGAYTRLHITVQPDSKCRSLGDL
jgi:hypothetical protein